MDIPTVIVSGLVTLIGSGIGTAVVNYWLAERRARRELRRTKLEELFLAFTSWSQRVIPVWITQYAKKTGKLPHDAANDHESEDPREAGGQKFDVVEILISLHFPELRASFQAILQCRQKIGDMLFVHESVTAFPGEMKKFNAAEKLLKDQIAQLAADVTNWK